MPAETESQQPKPLSIISTNEPEQTHSLNPGWGSAARSCSSSGSMPCASSGSIGQGKLLSFSVLSKTCLGLYGSVGTTRLPRAHGGGGASASMLPRATRSAKSRLLDNLFHCFWAQILNRTQSALFAKCLHARRKRCKPPEKEGGVVAFSARLQAPGLPPQIRAPQIPGPRNSKGPETVGKVCSRDGISNLSGAQQVLKPFRHSTPGPPIFLSPVYICTYIYMCNIYAFGPTWRTRGSFAASPLRAQAPRRNTPKQADPSGAG